MMAGIGIAIGVDAREVKRAKADIDALNRSLKETEEFESFEFGREGLGESERRLKQITEDVRRLKGLVRSGEKQGGLLNTNEFKEAATLSKRIREEWGGFSDHLAKVRQEMGALIREKAKLEKVDRDGRGFETPEAFAARHSRIDEITSEIEARKKGYDKLRALQGKMGGLADQGVSYTDAIGGYGRVMPNYEKAISRALKMGAGLVAGFSIYNYMSQGMGLASEYQPGLTDLRQRAGKGYTPGGGNLGFTLMEALGTSDQLSRQTGLRGPELARVVEAVQTFTRAAGLSDTGAAAGFATGTFPATGGNGARLLQGIFNLAKGSGRFEEFLSSTSAIFSQSSGGMGGMELSERQQARLLALQAGLWDLPGQMGKGASGAQLLGGMDAAIRGGGGSRGQQLLLLQALGGTMNSTEDYWNFKKTLAQGLSGPGTFAKVMQTLWGRYGSGFGDELSWSAEGKMALANTFAGGDPFKAEKLIELYRSGQYTEADVDRILKNGGPMSEEALASMKTPGGKTRSVTAAFQAGQERLGEDLLPILNKFREGVDAFVQGIRELDPIKAASGVAKSGPLGIVAAGATFGWQAAFGVGTAQGLDKLKDKIPDNQVPQASTEALGRAGVTTERVEHEIVLRVDASQWLKNFFDFSPGTVGPPETVR